MSNKIKLYVVGGSYGYANWIDNIQFVNNPAEADLIMFTGGEDVHPSLYGEEKGKWTYCNYNRDKYELEIFNAFIKTPKISICRGLQLCCVASGGKLIQDVNHHVGCTHGVLDTDTKEVYNIPSTHHQMIWPFDINHKLIGVASPKRSNTYTNGLNEEIKLFKGFEEPEICFFPDTMSLGIQSHPEACNDKKVHAYLNSLITKYLLPVKKLKFV
jgi:gamma-glutamyl-gamma-aminobutyrate hydrolase PuuD